jgi:hypothetical protein
VRDDGDAASLIGMPCRRAVRTNAAVMREQKRRALP